MRDEFFRFGHYFDKHLSDAMFICLSRWTQRDGVRPAVLSLDIRNESEIDEAFDILQRELAHARKAAKAAMRRRLSRREKQQKNQ